MVPQQHPAGRATDALFARTLIGQPTGGLPGRTYAVDQHPITGDYWWTSTRGKTFGSTLPIAPYTRDEKEAMKALVDVCGANAWFPTLRVDIADETGDPVWVVEIRGNDQRTMLGRGYADCDSPALAIVRSLLAASQFAPPTQNA